MANKNLESKLKQVYMVACPGCSNKFYTSFSEAQTMAEDLCEESNETVEIFKVNGFWQVLPPENPKPKVNQTLLSVLLEL